MSKNKPSMTGVLTKYVNEFGENVFSSYESVFLSYVKFEYLEIEDT